MAPVDLRIDRTANANVNRWMFTPSWLGTIYNFVLILFVGACTLVHYNNYDSSIGKSLNFGFERSVYGAVNVCSIVDTVGIILVFCSQRTTALTLFNKLNDTRESIEGNNNGKSDVEYNATFYKVSIIFLVNLSIWLVLISTILVYEYHFALTFLSLGLCTLIQASLTLQYCVNLIIIQDLFNTLNRSLSDTLKESNSSQQSASVCAIDGKISRIWEGHSQLSNLSRDFSKFYSLPMLLNTFSVFLSTTSSIYYVIKPIVFEETILTAFDYANSLSFVLAYLYPTILLTTFVASLVNENRKTSDILHDFLREPGNRTSKDKLLTFSMYLLHNDVKFSVFDLFSLDGSLLVSIAGSITTYMVILLQFHSERAA